MKYLSPDIESESMLSTGRNSCPHQDDGEENKTEKYISEMLREAASKPADCGHPLTPPSWVNMTQVTRGQAVFHRYFLRVFVSNLISLLCLLTVDGILKVLMYTGLSATPSASFKRYLGTLNHVRRWYSGDIFDQNSSAFRSIQLVRGMHTKAFTDAHKSEVVLASQSDMVVTQWAFFGLVLTHGPQLGIHCTRSEEESLVHFWKCIGYLLSIDDRYNVCSGELEEVRRRCKAILKTVIVEGLRNPPEDFAIMADNMLHGIHMITPTVDPAAFVAFTHHLFSLQCSSQSLSWYSTFMFNLMTWVFEYVSCIPVLGEIVRVAENNLLSLNLFLCNSLPTVALCYRCLETSIVNIIMAVLALWTRTLHCLKFKQS